MCEFLGEFRCLMAATGLPFITQAIGVVRAFCLSHEDLAQYSHQDRRVVLVLWGAPGKCSTMIMDVDY